MDVRLRVHIAPIGFEVRRITEPLIRMKADVVDLISLGQEDKASKFKKEVSRIIKQESPQIEIREEYANFWELFPCLAKYKEIFKREQGNEISVNVSTGSKVAAISGTLACMLWGGFPYYAKLDYGDEPPEKIKPEKVSGIEDVPTFAIKTPKPEILKALKFIESKGGEGDQESHNSGIGRTKGHSTCERRDIIPGSKTQSLRSWWTL